MGLKYILVKSIPIAGIGHFASFHGTRGWYDSLAVPPLMSFAEKTSVLLVTRQSDWSINFRSKSTGDQPVRSVQKSKK